MAARTMRPKRRRLVLLVSALALLGGAAALALTALDDTMRFFHSPSEVAAGTVQPGREFRLGGLVEEGFADAVRRLRQLPRRGRRARRYRRTIRGYCRTCSGRDRAWSQWAHSIEDGRSGRHRSSPSTTKPICRPRLRRRFAARRRRTVRDRGTRPFRAGAGAGPRPAAGRAAPLRSRCRQAGADGARPAYRARAIRPRRDRLRRPCARLCRIRLFGLGGSAELPFAQAAALPPHRRVGKPRRIAAALDTDPDAVRRDGGGIRRRLAEEHCRRGCSPSRR